MPHDVVNLGLGVAILAALGLIALILNSLPHLRFSPTRKMTEPEDVQALSRAALAVLSVEDRYPLFLQYYKKRLWFALQGHARQQFQSLCEQIEQFYPYNPYDDNAAAAYLTRLQVLRDYLRQLSGGGRLAT